MSGLATCGVISARGSAPQRVAVGQRFGVGHVERRAGDRPLGAARARARRCRPARRATTFTSQASSRIAASSPAPTRWRVAAVAGAAITTNCARGQTSPTRSIGSVPSRPRRVTAQDLDPEGLEQLDQGAADAPGPDDRRPSRPSSGRDRPVASTSAPARTRAGAARRPASGPARARRRRPKAGAAEVHCRSRSIRSSQRSTPAKGSCTQRTRSGSSSGKPSGFESTHTSASASLERPDLAARLADGRLDLGIGLGRRRGR